MSRTILCLTVLGLLLVALPAAAVGSASGVVVSELRFRGPAGASDEFVELANAGSAPVDVSGWRLQACSATAGAATTRVTVPAATTLAPGRHLLLAHTGYTGPVAPDLTYGTGIADDGGVRLLDAAGQVVDGVGSGAPATSECREGAGVAFPSANADASLERRAGGIQDTGDNGADFAVAEPSDPENSASQRPSVDVADAGVAEGDAGTAPATLTLTLTAVSRRPVTVTYATADGTAAAGEDYVSVAGTVTIPAGATRAAVTVDVLGDTVDEADETFTVTLLAADWATIGRATATVTIRDDDDAPGDDPPGDDDDPPGGNDPPGGDDDPPDDEPLLETVGAVQAAGLVGGDRLAVLALLAVRTSEDGPVCGHLVYLEPRDGNRLFVRELSSLRVEGRLAVVRGAGELNGAAVEVLVTVDAAAQTVSVSTGESSFGGRLRAGRLSVAD